MKARYFITPFLCSLLLTLASCSDDIDTYSNSNESSDDNETTVDNSETEALIATYEITTDDAMEDNASTHEESDDYTWDDSSFTLITLNTTSVSISGSGATASGTTVTITDGGNYKITGTLSDGLIHINNEDDSTIKVYFDGVNVSNSTNAPFFAEDASKVIIFLADGTTNYFTDTDTYVFEDDNDEPNAAFFSKTDMTITGNGTLTVTGNYNDGIASKDGLIITDGPTINVTAADDGIRGKDYLVIEDSTIDITSSGDGFKSDNDDDTTYGYVYLASSDITINTLNDGIQAESDALIASGTITITSGGGSSVVLGDNDDSAKGIKAETYIIVDDGTLTIDAADDAFNSNDALVINGGTLDLATGDDALHADTSTAIYDGTITVSESYEGIEGAIVIIAGGTNKITSSDDGINAAGDDYDNTMYFAGGYTVVNASGDGIDANGSIIMIDGTLLVNGPTNSGNGAIDYDDSFTINGGTLVAAGSSGMAQTASSGSAQNAILIKFNSSKQANTLVNISDVSGTNVLTFAPSKTYQSIAFSSADLEEGENYTISTGGSASGTGADGYYTDATYSGGTTYTTFTISGTITTVN